VTTAANRQTTIPNDPPPGWERETPKYRVTIKGVFIHLRTAAFALSHLSRIARIRMFGSTRRGPSRKARLSIPANGRTLRFYR
jgi:hypothetical protein